VENRSLFFYTDKQPYIVSQFLPHCNVFVMSVGLI
jgi:hypothetical protein